MAATVNRKRKNGRGWKVETLPRQRRYHCAHYTKCLDRAAKRNTKGMGCHTCNRYRPAEREPIQHDIEGILRLMAAIFGTVPEEAARMFWNPMDGYSLHGGVDYIEHTG